ncbi:hypothetical protein QZH41_005411 [Actinostola sp. cb2023]|nr:hypothetical protein QZH41_005411 [Actinostola sp. cb2023]
MSLMTQPMMLDHELCLTPISLIVEKVDGTKNIACRRALEGLLGGKFQVQTNLEKKMEDEAREEEEERERVAKTREEAANDKDNQPESGDGPCFPGSAEITVVEEGREKKMQMRDLKIGRSVKTFDPITGACTFSPVVAFIHRDPDKPERFHKLTLDTGNSITLSGNHLLMTGEAAEGSKTAAEIKIGDILLIETGAVGKVVETRRVLEVGIYCPLTRKGTLCVNGVLASCYASVGDRRVGLFNITVSGHQIAHMALTPLRMWKRIVPAKGTAIIPVFDPYVNWLKKTRMAAFFAGPIN